MKVESLMVRPIAVSGRIDAGYFLSAGRRAAIILSSLRDKGMAFRRVGQPGGMGRVWQPNRFKRAYATMNEDQLPYLRPYDVFSYLPSASDQLSVARNSKISTYRLRRGMILQSCSGRNLGPAVAVDGYLEKFLIGDDMLRIEIADEALRYYVLAFLRTSLGQALLRQGKTGSVIDHISDGHVASLEIPMVSDKDLADISDGISKSVVIRESSRTVIDSAQMEYEAGLPRLDYSKSLATGWSMRASTFRGRVDAAPYVPAVLEVRRLLIAAGAAPVSAHAVVMKPAGRYKTNYVGATYGTPILSGTQLLQHLPINLQYMAPGALKEQAAYELHTNWIAYQADGRAEDSLGWPVVVTRDRDGWLASGHVGRVVPRSGTRLGWLYAALRTPHAQMQLKSLASGSVVDATFVEDMESVILPSVDPSIDWTAVETAWEGFAEASALENRAVERLETLLRGSRPGLM